MEQAMYSGKSLRVQALGGGLAELVFDREGDAINKLDARTVNELREATAVIAADASLRGILVSSSKSVFIVGADITEFGERFKLPESELADSVEASNQIFVAFEDLKIPSVVAINGFALGGGLEFVLACALRVMATGAQIGVPEVKLGLFPGFGGTVRLPRVAGAALAVDWVASGKSASAAAARDGGVVDEICAPQTLPETAPALLGRAVDGQVDWQVRQQRKRVPLADPAHAVLFADALDRVRMNATKHQPAEINAVTMLA